MKMEGQTKEYPFFEELYNYNKASFKYHLSIPNNNRILFSGKFGVGKSTFLDRFFLKKTLITYIIYIPLITQLQVMKIYLST